MTISSPKLAAADIVFDNAHRFLANRHPSISLSLLVEVSNKETHQPLITSGNRVRTGCSARHGQDAGRGDRCDERGRAREQVRPLLPVVEHETQPVPLDMTEVDPARGNGQHFVSIDDDEVMNSMVQGLLLRLGYRAPGFLSAQEAIESISSSAQEVDLVVTDFNMPGLSGLDVVRILAGIRPGLPVVISSGYVSDDLRASAAALGVRAVLQKEHTIEELGAVVHEALRTGPK